MKKWFALFAMVLLLGCSHETSKLSIQTSDGQKHVFTVEIANTPAQAKKGLMFRESMPADHGMLFMGESPHVWTMWMKNTIIPLDMIFIDQKGIIVTITENTVPYSLEVISSRAFVSAVLEVNAGTVKRLNIQIGDQVIFPVDKQG